ncbi:MAG TPA: hypothetical protein PK156_18740 [Polyangium sp.]|nr:hypothetical protein [Polyangium sp.]
MTNEPTNPSVRQEEDVLPPRLLLYVMVGMIAFSLAIAGVAYVILRSQERALRPSGEFSEMWLGPIIERSNVYEDLYGNAGPGQLQNRNDQAELEQVEWANREQRIVRVPIEMAIELYVSASAP